jgi:hypothetical protein
MTSTKPVPAQPGIAVTTSIAAGGDAIASNHAEGILVSAAPKAMQRR